MFPLFEDQYKRQTDELQVLQSIFGDDIVFVKIENCWKQPCPLEIRIRLKPPLTNEVFVALELEVICTNNYPDEVPNISLKNLMEISTTKAEELRKLLIQRATELIGIEMIYDLCQFTQDFLALLNKRPIYCEHENMLKTNADKEIEKRRIRADSENRVIAEIAEEIEQRRLEKLNRIDEKEDLERKNRLRVLHFGELGDCEIVEMLGAENNNPKRIYKITNFKESRPSIHQRATEWRARDQDQQILVTEWSFEYTLGRKSNRKQSINFTRFENLLESFTRSFSQKLGTLKVDDQQFFSKYLFVNLKKVSTSSTNFNCRLLIGQSVESEDKCLALADTFNHIKISANRLAPQLAAQIVCALKWLHGQGFTHGHLHPYSVWFTNSHIFQLSDYLLIPHIFELCKEFDKLTNPNTISEDRKNSQEFRRDLFCLGTLLNSILQSNGKDSDSIAMDFIKDCQGGKSIETIAEHKYLIQEFFQPNASNQSNLIPGFSTQMETRLAKEFQVIKWLGKGGFGDVYLARNKLDDNDYAVKRIPLNPNNERLNKKVRREAQLFAKLNHEHVVRYFSAWIENVSLERVPDSLNGNSLSLSKNLSPVQRQKVPLLDKVSEKDGSEDWNPSFRKVAPTTSSKSSSGEESSSSSDSDAKCKESSKNETFETIKTPNKMFPFQQNIQTLFSAHTPGLHSKSAGYSEFDVVFEEDDDENVEPDSFTESPIDNAENDANILSKQASENTTTISSNLFRPILYIQMEYCKNSTLKNLIDTKKLYLDSANVWRIFREILSGLQYIHHQNMIHRDIKPMNILMDANWSVKIGDFGLATRDLFGNAVEGDNFETSAQENLNASGDNHYLQRAKQVNDGTPSGFTKNVGTKMYIAPEIERSSGVSTKFYTSKIDVFSVGIVLFEMLYKPPETATERFIILQNLRNRCEFPEDFCSKITPQQKSTAKKLISWMLKLNPTERPNVDMLLQSEIIPLVDYGEDDFQKMFTQIISKRKSRLYKWIMNSLLHQKTSPALNYCFDATFCTDMHKRKNRNIIIQKIQHELERIFEVYAFISFPTNTLVPLEEDEQQLNGTQEQYIVLDSSGLALKFPKDLRQSFVRYCARNPIDRIKRFVVGKVFSPSDLAGPTTTRELLAAEIIHLSYQIIRTLPVLNSLKWTLYFGHFKIIKAACLHLGICDLSTQNKVLQKLYSFFVDKKKITYEQKLEDLIHKCDLSHQMASSILKLLEPVKDLDDFNTQLRPLLRSKTPQIRDLAKESFDEIAKILSLTRLFIGEKFQNIVFDCTLSYRPQTFSQGLVYFFSVDYLEHSRLNSFTILAGGAFEASILAEKSSKDPPTSDICAYGFNLSLDNLAHLHEKRFGNEFSYCSVLICSTSTDLNKIKFELAQRLWELNISTDIFQEVVTSVFPVLEYSYKNSIQFLLLIIDQNEIVIYQLDESSSTQSKKSSLHGYKILQLNVNSFEAVKIVQESYAGTSHHSSKANDFTGLDLSTINTASLLSTSSSVQLSNSTSSSSFSNVNINYTIEDKPPHNVKKKHEIQIRNAISDLLAKINPKTRVEVFVTELMPELLRLIASSIDRTFSQSELDQAFQTIIKQAGRQKFEVESLFQNLQPFFTSSGSSPLLILWSRPIDHFYRVIA